MPGELDYSCCGIRFPTLQDMYDHYDHVHKQDHPIDQQEQGFMNPNDIFLRQEKKHLCPECNKAYKNASGLKYHLMSHKRRKDENKPYKCPIDDCDRGYRNLNGLKYHVDKVHNQSLGDLRKRKMVHYQRVVY